MGWKWHLAQCLEEREKLGNAWGTHVKKTEVEAHEGEHRIYIQEDDLIEWVNVHGGHVVSEKEDLEEFWVCED